MTLKQYRDAEIFMYVSVLFPQIKSAIYRLWQSYEDRSKTSFYLSEYFGDFFQHQIKAIKAITFLEQKLYLQKPLNFKSFLFSELFFFEYF